MQWTTKHNLCHSLIAELPEHQNLLSGFFQCPGPRRPQSGLLRKEGRPQTAQHHSPKEMHGRNQKGWAGGQKQPLALWRARIPLMVLEFSFASGFPGQVKWQSGEPIFGKHSERCPNSLERLQNVNEWGGSLKELSQHPWDSLPLQSKPQNLPNVHSSLGRLSSQVLTPANQHPQHLCTSAESLALGTLALHPHHHHPSGFLPRKPPNPHLWVRLPLPLCPLRRQLAHPWGSSWNIQDSQGFRDPRGENSIP